MGKDRNEAIRRKGLDELKITGIKTNIDFQKQILRVKVFQQTK